MNSLHVASGGFDLTQVYAACDAAVPDSVWGGGAHVPPQPPTAVWSLRTASRVTSRTSPRLGGYPGGVGGGERSVPLSWGRRTA